MRAALIVAPIMFRRHPLIGIAYLASSLSRAGHQVRVYDINTDIELENEEDEAYWNEEDNALAYLQANRLFFEKYIEDIIGSGIDLIGFTLWQTTRVGSLFLTDIIKEKHPDLPVVFGGPDVSFSWRKIISGKADFLVAGEGEAVLTDIIEAVGKPELLKKVPGLYCIKGDGYVQSAPRQEIRDLDTLPFPDFSFFRMEKYHLRKNLPISFNRGCVRYCVFCNIHNDWEKLRTRSAENIHAEMHSRIKDYPEKTVFETASASLNQLPKVLEELCGLIEEDPALFGITWGGDANFCESLSNELIEKMYRAGCRNLGFGLESGAQRIIDRMGKRYKIGDAERIIRKASDLGIEVSLNTIVGFPGETEEDFEETMSFLGRNVEYIKFIGEPSELCILPGTELEINMKDFGIIGDAGGFMWKDENGGHEMRKKRIIKFKEFLEMEGLKSLHTFKRVKEVGEKTRNQ